MEPKTIYRITTFFKRRPDLTEQEFYDYWANVHGPLVIPWALKHGTIEYTQYRTPASLRALVKSGMDGAFSGSHDYDAGVDWYVESYEKYLAAYSDPYYREVIEPDEDNFVDKGQLDKGKKETVRAISTLGDCKMMIRDGKPVVEVREEIWNRFQGIGKN